MWLKNKGFTLVELAVVIVVIAILATIVIASYNGTQAQARDAKRVDDLSKIAEAIGLYHIKYGDDIQSASGCGSGGNGSGWFNYEGSSYPRSILNCLIDKGYLDSKFVDPFTCTTTSGSPAPYPAGSCKRAGYAYMKYSAGSGDTAITCVYARLENNGDASKLTDPSSPCAGASSAGVANSYGMNYQIKVTR